MRPSNSTQRQRPMKNPDGKLALFGICYTKSAHPRHKRRIPIELKVAGMAFAMYGCIKGSRDSRKGGLEFLLTLQRTSDIRRQRVNPGVSPRSPHLQHGGDW